MGSISTPWLGSYKSPLGRIILAGSVQGLSGLWFEDQLCFGSTLTGHEEENPDFPLFTETSAWLDVYFAGENPSFTPQLDLRGSAFRRLIWSLLLQLPYGTTATYGQLAQKAALLLGRERLSAQAVGGAVGHNPVSLIVPCHRVIGSNGSLTGYAGGLDRKKRLLDLEQPGKR